MTDQVYKGPKQELTLDQLQAEIYHPHVQHVLSTHDAIKAATKPEALYSLANLANRAINAPGYVARFAKLKCAQDLLELGVYPNVKEITESMAAMYALRQHLRHLKWTDSSITALVVGDGATPRTGALLAFLTSWKVISVDPSLAGRETWWKSRVKRLEVIGSGILDAPHIQPPTTVVVLTVHSHARYEDIREWLGWAVDWISIPCCGIACDPGNPPIEYVDYWIRSPERIVRVWKGV